MHGFCDYAQNDGGGAHAVRPYACTPVRHHGWINMETNKTFTSNTHHRRSLRLKDYDYAQAGAYFVTLCTRKRICLLGDVLDGIMQRNETGQIVAEEWLAIPTHFPHATLDQFIVMPNHMHGIIIVGAQFIAPKQGMDKQGAMNRAPTLGKMVRAFKARSTRGIRCQTNAQFAWQRNYYEHVIRDENDLARIREYITNNPLQWELDREHPRFHP